MGRNERSIGCAVTLALAGLALIPGTATAATPIEVGAGGDVSLVVDETGAAQVAWTQDNPDAVGYCRVPRGTTTQGCPAPQTFPVTNPGNGIFNRALVAMPPGRLFSTTPNTVVVIWRECCTPEEVNARVSPDGGASFAAPTTLAKGGPGTENTTSPTSDAIANDAMTHVGWSDGTSFQYAPLAGPELTTRAQLFGPVSFGGAAGFAQGRPLVVEESDTKQLSFRRNLTGDPNDEANWSAAKPIPTEGFGAKRPSLGYFGDEDGEDYAGPFLAYTDSAGGQPDRPHVREYDSGTDAFEVPRVLGGARDPLPTLVADQPVQEIDIEATTRPPGFGIGVDLVWSNSAGIWWTYLQGDGWASPILLTALDGVTHLEVSRSAAPGCLGGPSGCGFAGARTVDGKVWVVPLADTETPGVEVGGRSSRRLGGTVPVTATCDEDCTVEAAGRITISGGGSRTALASKGALKLKPAGAELRAGEEVTLKPRLKAKGKKLAKRALERDSKVVAKVTVTAADPGGNVATAKRKVRLRR